MYSLYRDGGKNVFSGKLEAATIFNGQAILISYIACLLPFLTAVVLFIGLTIALDSVCHFGNSKLLVHFQSSRGPIMHFTSSVALVAAVASVALASPVDIRDSIKKSKSFTVHQVPSTKKTKLQPVLQVAKTYAKFGKVLPVAVSKAAAAAQQTGTVAAVPEANDESYLCPVTVGGTVMNLDFDTGSADLWVYSTLQPWTQQSGHAVYNPNDGTSTMLSGDTWDITYGDGSTAEGVVYADTVVVGAVTATSQAVEAATSVSSAFMADVASDGLVGLAFSSINTVQPTQQTTFFDTVKSSLKAPVFTALLKKGAAGSYDFG